MAIKILMVMDSDFQYQEPAETLDFTFITLVGTLTGAGMQVTKAHRTTDPHADLQNFNFATSANLLDYDVLWLLGRAGRNSETASGTSALGIGDDEVAAIAAYMDAGGGVFAVGDHDSIGAEMCGRIPRVRAMRSWYGAADSATPMAASFPVNFPTVGTGRADTTQRNPAGDYQGDPKLIWFENQSDSIPQPIVPSSSPAHPVLRQDGADIVIYPDHMHEGKTHGDLTPAYDYAQSLHFNGQTFVEFPMVAGDRKLPEAIAAGQSISQHVKYAATLGDVDTANADPKPVNALSVYEGRAAGVGRIVTGSTFHHYIDINQTGDSTIVTAQQKARTGPDAAKGDGFGTPGAEAVFATIKQVHVNIAQWLARPRPAIALILERSTFSQDEVTANPGFAGAVLVTVDGLKPSQFPGGPIDTLMPDMPTLAAWAPTIAPADATDVTFTPTAVSSDDPSLSDRLQRFTFTYTATLSTGDFGFPDPARTVEMDATLSTPAASAPLTDRAWIELVKSANPFMLDLDNGNTTAWLSSDLRVFPVVADGHSHHGHTLANNATRGEALQYLRDVVGGMSAGQFTTEFSLTEGGSALSALSTTTVSHKKVYNFAIARVRLNHAAASADVRVFFRVVPSPTTAGLTYHVGMSGPTDTYLQTAGADPIALPGTNGAGTEWASFPMFSFGRMSPPSSQQDADNKKPMGPTGSEISTFYGALIDTNLDDPYLPLAPGGGGAVGLPTLLMGEHQCLVAEIFYSGAPIPNGAQPATSDKLAQRNLAYSPIANPGLDASRAAFHTFEIEAAAHPVSDDWPPDELLLDWRNAPPEGTEVQVFISAWDAEAVVALADRFYPRHEIRAVDTHTIAVPGGGMRYVPIPPSAQRRTGIVSADFPLGVRKGERFDLAVRQITNRFRQGTVPPPKTKRISKEEAARLVAELGVKTPAGRAGAKAAAAPPRGVFDLGGNKVLVTDLRVYDQAGDHALIVQHPDPKILAAAARNSGAWRETIGAFQLGIPVSTRADMLAHHLRLLSAMRWRAEWLRPNSRWYATFRRYVEMIAEKVRALGGDPYTAPPNQNGDIPLPGDGGREGGHDDGYGDHGGHGDGWPGGGREPVEGGEEPGLWWGKITGLLFDHFGDFDGFILETAQGARHRFFSREAAILRLARDAWLERYVVTVSTLSPHSHRLRHLLIGGEGV
jgi:hypothetical protein